LENTVSLIKVPPGARFNTLRSFAEHESTPGMPEHALEIFSEFETTKSTLLPIFEARPRRTT